MTEIPNAFGGFAPFPNTIMIPTMGLQSDVIGFRFGFGYEKGKRTLRAMSNEQFNDLTEEAEQAIYKRHESTAINFFQLEIQNWTNLQQIIIEKSVEIEKMKAQRTPSAFREIFNGFTAGFTTQQSEDASNFFTNFTDPIMKLIGWFSGGKQSISVPTSGRINPRAPPPKPQPTPEPQPTPSPTIDTQSQTASKARIITLIKRVNVEIVQVQNWTQLLAKNPTSNYLKGKLFTSKSTLKQLLTLSSKLNQQHRTRFGNWVSL